MTYRAVIRRSAATLSLALTVLLLGPSPRPGADVAPAASQSRAHPAPASRARIAETLAQLPLAFEPNQGQSAGDVKFLTRAPGYLLQLTATGMRMIVSGAPDQRARPTAASGARPAQEIAHPAHVLTFTWLDTNPRADVAPESALPGTVNYLKGSDPAKWQTGITTYERVRYRAIYPGVDVVYYGNGRQLEYDLVVAPRADPHAARLAIAGAEATLTGSGDLELALSDGRVVDLRAPVAYQERDGQRVPVDAGYRVSAAETGTEVSFDLGDYDRELPLVIDPLVYSTFLGGSFTDGGIAIAVTAANEAFVTGYTASTTGFPTTVGAFDTSTNGLSDVFVTRVNSTGTALVYSTFLGGGHPDVGYGIAVNAANEAFVTGSTNSTTDFPVTPGAFDVFNNGDDDAFVARLNSTGTALIYSTFLGSRDDDGGSSIAVNAANEAFVTGYTVSAGEPAFPTTAGAFDTVQNGNLDAFVTRLNSTGTALVYSTYLGGGGYDRGYGIAVNAADEAFVTGDASYSTAASDFPTTAGAFDTSHNGLADVFVTRVNSTGTSLLYSTFVGGRGVDKGHGIAVNAANEAFVTGEADEFPVTAGAFDTGFNGAGDAFVTRLNSAGNALVYSTFLGGSYVDYATGIAITAADEAFVAGWTLDGAIDFPTTPGAFDTSHNGGWNVFVTRLDSTGAALIYSTFLGGSGGDAVGYGIAVNAAAEAFVTGWTLDSVIGFPTTVGAFDTTHNGGVTDAFVTRLDTTPPPPPDPPTNLRVTGMTGNVVTFGWIPPTAGPPPTGYQIEGGFLPGQVLGSLLLGPAPSATITLPTGSFYLRVRTLANGLASGPSNEVLVHVNVPMAPSAPTNLLGLVVGDTLHMAWTNTFGGGAPTNVILDVSGTLSGSAPLGLTDTFSFSGVPPGTYTLTVRATNASGSSVASNPVTLTFPGGCGGAPLPVTNFVAYNIGGTTFLSWDTATGGPAPTGYVLNVTGSFVGALPTPVKALSGAVPAGTYNLSIAATNPCGTSAPTAVQTVIMP